MMKKISLLPIVFMLVVLVACDGGKDKSSSSADKEAEALKQKLEAIEKEREREQTQFDDVNRQLQEMEEENQRLKNKVPASCLAHLSANPESPDGIYTIDLDGESGPDKPFSVYCDMTNDGGGWTRVVNIKGDSVFHADNPKAIGDVSDASAAAKLSDEGINQLTTIGYWRYECGKTKKAFVRNDEGVWTSVKQNTLSWSMDNDKDGVFECAASRSGYVFSDYPACAAEHSNYAAILGPPEGNGCYVHGEGWNLDGFLWAK